MIANLTRCINMAEIITAMKCNETTYTLYTICNNCPISCKLNNNHILRVDPIECQKHSESICAKTKICNCIKDTKISIKCQKAKQNCPIFQVLIFCNKDLSHPTKNAHQLWIIAYYMLIDNYSQLPRTMEQTFPMYTEYIYNESNVNLPSELISVLKLSFFWCLLAICVLFSCYSISFHSFIQSFDMYSHNSTIQILAR